MTIGTTFGEKTLAGYAARARAARGALTDLDRRAGDGDFGDNLCGGLDTAEQHPAGGFEAMAAVFLDEVGGTSGPLYGLLFQSLARASLDAATPEAAMREGLREGLAAIQRVGEARVGDRTMVDALAPAVAALDAGGDIASAAHAAAEGARSTVALRARSGRASYVGERALGAPDPGAVGIALLLAAAAEALGGPPDRLDGLLGEGA